MASQPQLESNSRLPQVGSVLAGKYCIERLLACGGMGAVFVARHTVTGRKVAIKCLLTDPSNDAEATHRLIREGRTASRVQHFNVVDMYDVGEHEGSLFLVMELLEGETFSDLLKRRGPLSVEETLHILIPTMRGVRAAHRVQVIHRDLKPSNIFLCCDRRSDEITPRVLDFGISKVLGTHGDAEHSLTQTGAVVGTPFYMAPEQLTDHPIDQRIDVYALGVILYQALSGRLPFSDPNYNALVVQIATATPKPLSKLRRDLPPGLSDVVARAMARDITARYAGVAELMDALRPFVRGSSARAGRRRRRRAVIGLGLALIVGGLSALLWTRYYPARETPQVVTSDRAGHASGTHTSSPKTSEPQPTAAAPTPPSPVLPQPSAAPAPVSSAQPTAAAATQGRASAPKQSAQKRARAKSNAAKVPAKVGESIPPSRQLRISPEEF